VSGTEADADFPSSFWFGMAGAGATWQAAITCLVSYVAFSLQKEEIIGGQTPSGYPGKELSVGSGDVSG
jgi:hypothetical protein